MALNRTTSPPPLWVGFDVREHLIVQHDADNDLVQHFLRAAVELVEAHAARQFITAGWTLTLDCFPRGGQPIELRVCPVRSVESITYVDAAGEEQELPEAEYIVDTASEPGRITPAYGLTWPTTRRQVNAVTVNFVAGYTDPEDSGSTASVPAAAKQAVLLLVGHWYANREAVTDGAMNEVPLAVRSLIDSLKWTL